MATTESVKKATRKSRRSAEAGKDEDGSAVDLAADEVQLSFSSALDLEPGELSTMISLQVTSQPRSRSDILHDMPISVL